MQLFKSFLYICLSAMLCIQPISSTPIWTTTFGTCGSGNNQFEIPGGIALGADGKLYVSDSDNNRLQIFDTHNGNKFVSKFGTYGSDDEQFENLGGVVILA